MALVAARELPVLDGVQGIPRSFFVAQQIKSERCCQFAIPMSDSHEPKFTSVGARLFGQGGDAEARMQCARQKDG